MWRACKLHTGRRPSEHLCSSVKHIHAEQSTESSPFPCMLFFHFRDANIDRLASFPASMSCTDMFCQNMMVGRIVQPCMSLLRGSGRTEPEFTGTVSETTFKTDLGTVYYIGNRFCVLSHGTHQNEPDTTASASGQIEKCVNIQRSAIRIFQYH